jgi:citrate lyase subunit beta/citryl-CoA lyase
MRRSLLFVPGNSPAMLQSANVFGADVLILDLEDAVAPHEKDAARTLVRSALKHLAFSGAEIAVRLNPLGSPYFADDVREIVLLRPQFLMPAKVGSAQDVRLIEEAVAEAEAAGGVAPGSVGLMPLLETALGIENAYLIAAASPRVKGLLLGAEDLCADLTAARTKEGAEIAFARGRVVMAARAAGVDAFDTPFTDVDDEEGLARDAALARALGFSGKAAISPRHVPAINEAFSPSQADILYAREVMAALREGERLGRGAVSLRGKMVDRPVAQRARRVLDAARALGLWEGEA